MDELDQRDHYEVLGVSRSATAEEIKRAYRQQMARYHPDRFAGASREAQEEAGRRAQRINEAYRTLSDFAARNAYNRTLPAEGKPAQQRTTPATSASPPARDHLAELYEQARAHLAAGRTLQAAATLREIQALNPFYRDSAALLEQAEAAAKPAPPRRPEPAVVTGADSGPDKGRRALLVGGIGGLLLAGAGVGAWLFRRQAAAQTGLPTGAAPAGGAPTIAAPTAVPPTSPPTAVPPTIPPTVVPTAVPPTAAVPTAVPPTALPTASLAPTAPPANPTSGALAEEGSLIYAESFDGGAGWPTLSGNGWSVGPVAGAYEIVVRQGAGNIWAFSTSPIGADFQLAVDVEVSGGLGGLMTRFTGGSYLSFLVDPNAGVYRLEQWLNGSSTVLAAEAHPAVALEPGARNRLLVRLEGTLVALRVNGVPVAELNVDAPPPGERYGLVARASAAEVVARFTNLALRELA